MSGPPRIRSTNLINNEKEEHERESRPVLAPAGNKTRPVVVKQSTINKPQRKSVIPPPKEKDKEKEKEKKVASVIPSVSPSPMNVSFLSDVSSESSSSRSSSRASSSSGRRNLKNKPRVSSPKPANNNNNNNINNNKNESPPPPPPVFIISDDLQVKKRCPWVTPNSDSCYIAFHDEEWGVPVHDDRRLFEILSLSGTLAELTWPSILKKRHIFRDVFLDFDPVAVSKLNEKKIISQGSPASSLLSELRLRGIIENARQICKIKDEFGTFDKYIWNYINQKPIVSQFRYPRQVPVKTSKAEFISKDLVRRGFRSVGPTVVHTFMQVAGLTNDHLISCFRFQECIALPESREKDYLNAKVEGKMDVEHASADETTELVLVSATDDLRLSTM